MSSLGDRLVTVAQRVWHAIKMGLIVSVVALGSAAIWFVVNAPDNAPAAALLKTLEAGPELANDIAPEGWTHFCASPDTTDLRQVFREQTEHNHAHCEGWNGPLSIYGKYTSFGFTGPQGCLVIPVTREVLRTTSKDAPHCQRRKGLMMLTVTDATPPELKLQQE